MKEFLFVLFYQVIGAVEAAVIIGGIVWLAKRKDEKDGRKPNPDFTPPPEKKPEVELRSALIKTVNGEKIAQRWYSPDEQIPQYAILQGEPYKFLAEMDKDGGKLVEFVRIKPTTTGTSAIEPKPKAVEGHITQCEYCRFYTGESPDYGLCDIWKERVWMGMTCIEFKPKARTDNRCFNCKKFSWMKPSRDVGYHLPFCDNINCFLDDDPHEFSCSNHAKMEQKEINMRETIHEDEMRKEDAKESKYDNASPFYAPFCNLTREQVLDGLDRYTKAFHPNDLLDRVENEMKRIKDDQRTGTQPIQSFIGEVRGGPGNEVKGTVTAKSAEELEEKLKALSDRLDRAEKKPVTPERLKEAGLEVEPVNIFTPAKADFLDAKCGDCKFFVNSLNGGYCTQRGWAVNAHEKRRCRLFEKYEAPVRTTHICKNCKHYLETEEGATTGLCGMKDEITFGSNYSACFEKREEKDHE